MSFIFFDFSIGWNLSTAALSRTAISPCEDQLPSCLTCHRWPKRWCWVWHGLILNLMVQLWCGDIPIWSNKVTRVLGVRLKSCWALAYGFCSTWPLKLVSKQNMKNYIRVSTNGRTPKSSISIGLSIVNPPFFGISQFQEPPVTGQKVEAHPASSSPRSGAKNTPRIPGFVLKNS